MKINSLIFSKLNKTDSEIISIGISLPRVNVCFEYFYPEGKVEKTGWLGLKKTRYYIQNRFSRDKFSDVSEVKIDEYSEFVRGGKLWTKGKIFLKTKEVSGDYCICTFETVQEMVSILTSLSKVTPIQGLYTILNGEAVSLYQFCSSQELQSLISDNYGKPEEFEES